MSSSMVSPSSAVEEKLSVTTAIIGLLAVGGMIIDDLWDLSTTPNKRSNATFAQALQEIRQCRSTVHVLYKTLSLLESAQLPYPERGTWIKVDDLIAVLTDTVLAVSALQAICKTRNLGKPGLATPPPDDADLDFDGGLPSKKTIEGLCSRIRWHNLSMTMMMTILKCPGESDAQNSKVGLDRRMARLLSANTVLSGRMRQLDHVLLGRRETLHYSSPARHPHFWLLPRLAPYPGTAAANRLPATAPAPNISNATTAASAAADGNGPAAQSSSPPRGYTLADIAVLSTVPLPVTTNELVDGNLFYTFAYARRVGGDLSELMASQAGQGTSRSLGIILGRLTNTSIDNGASSSSTGGSSSDSNSSPVVAGAGAGAGAGTETGSEANDGHARAKKWKVRSFRIKRRWRA